MIDVCFLLTIFLNFPPSLPPFLPSFLMNRLRAGDVREWHPVLGQVPPTAGRWGGREGGREGGKEGGRDNERRLRNVRKISCETEGERGGRGMVDVTLHQW